MFLLIQTACRLDLPSLHSAFWPLQTPLFYCLIQWCATFLRIWEKKLMLLSSFLPPASAARLGWKLQGIWSEPLVKVVKHGHRWDFGNISIWIRVLNLAWCFVSRVHDPCYPRKVYGFVSAVGWIQFITLCAYWLLLFLILCQYLQLVVVQVC